MSPSISGEATIEFLLKKTFVLPNWPPQKLSMTQLMKQQSESWIRLSAGNTGGMVLWDDGIRPGSGNRRV